MYRGTPKKRSQLPAQNGRHSQANDRIVDIHSVLRFVIVVIIKNCFFTSSLVDFTSFKESQVKNNIPKARNTCFFDEEESIIYSFYFDDP